MRQYSTIDRVIIRFEAIFQAGFLGSDDTLAYPARGYHDNELSAAEQRHSAGLMRVNHAGEVAAQALYQSQALATSDITLKAMLQHSATEEYEHLTWCTLRLQELNANPSQLTLVWYVGSFSIGFVVGLLGDQWSLAFLAETEHQVVKHLDLQLEQLPENDQRSRAILMQMRQDELQHATTAEAAAAKTISRPVQYLMSLLSKIMTTTAYKF